MTKEEKRIIYAAVMEHYANVIYDKLAEAYDPKAWYMKQLERYKDCSIVAYNKDCIGGFYKTHCDHIIYMRENGGRLEIYGYVYYTNPQDGQHDSWGGFGKLVISKDEISRGGFKQKMITAMPYSYDVKGPYYEFPSNMESFSHFVHSCVMVPYDKVDKDFHVQGKELIDAVKNALK